MARIRSVHPALFTDEAWVSCSPFARLLVIGLWTDADDQGVFEWKPLQLKMRLMPGDAADVPALLEELVAADLISPFEVAGKRYGAVRNFRKFQRPKKPNALHPLPAEIREYVCISETSSEPAADDGSAVTPQSEPVPHQFPTSSEIPPQMEDGGWRMEGKNKEADASLSAVAAQKRTRASKRAPESWEPSPRTYAQLVEEGFAVGDLERALTRMRDHEFKTPRTDWDATFRNWVRADADRKPSPRHDRPYDDKFARKEANLARAFAGSERAAGLRGKP